MRRDKSGGATWALVGDKHEGKVRCRSCSAIVFASKWWSHSCQLEDTLVDDVLSPKNSTNNQSNLDREDGESESSLNVDTKGL